MTSEEKQLLLQDLCTRLPYGVIGVTEEGVESPLLTRGEADWDILTSLNYRIVKHGWRPYLRPMSSMTEEEKKEYNTLVFDYEYDDYWYPGKYVDAIGVSGVDELIDFYNKYHFDYRGLIPIGLALPAPEGMYNN